MTPQDDEFEIQRIQEEERLRLQNRDAMPQAQTQASLRATPEMEHGNERSVVFKRGSGDGGDAAKRIAGMPRLFTFIVLAVLVVMVGSFAYSKLSSKTHPFQRILPPASLSTRAVETCDLAILDAT